LLLPACLGEQRGRLRHGLVGPLEPLLDLVALPVARDAVEQLSPCPGLAELLIPAVRLPPQPLHLGDLARAGAGGPGPLRVALARATLLLERRELPVQPRDLELASLDVRLSFDPPAILLGGPLLFLSRVEGGRGVDKSPARALELPMELCHRAAGLLAVPHRPPPPPLPP